MSEPVWTFDSKINKLNTRLTEATEQMNDKLDKTVITVNTAVQFIKTDIQNDLQKHRDSLTKITEEFTKNIHSEINSCKLHVESCQDFINKSQTQVDMYKDHVDDCKAYIDGVKAEIQNELTIHDQQQNRREVILNNTVNALSQKIDRLHFDIIDNEDNVSVTYVNPDGKIEYGGFRKPVPDGKTIISTIDKKLAWKYKFDINDFKLTNDVVTVSGMSLRDGKHLTADKINNELNNATYNIANLTQKVTNIIEKLSSTNGYVTSNNFKKAIPTEEQLYNFVIGCLSTTSNKITKDQIPTATKVKNTFDNHIWVLNRVHVNGLTQSKWEDFGSDTICIASNDGVHGIVAGSQERYKGFIDLQGRITINGLQEDLNEILKSIENINIDLNKIQEDFSAKLVDIENRLVELEK